MWEHFEVKKKPIGFFKERDDNEWRGTSASYYYLFCSKKIISEDEYENCIMTAIILHFSHVSHEPNKLRAT